MGLLSFDLSSSSLLASLLVSSVGFGLFIYGKKQLRIPQLLTGLAMMVYPYFLTAALPMLCVFGVLLGLLWCSLRVGV